MMKNTFCPVVPCPIVPPVPPVPLRYDANTKCLTLCERGTIPAVIE